MESYLGGVHTQTADDVYACASGIAVGNCVYVSAAGTVAVADAGSSGTVPAVGVVTAKPTTTSCRVTWFGNVDGFSGLTPGGLYFLGTAGAISASPGTIPNFVGIAITATRLLVMPGAVGLGAAEMLLNNAQTFNALVTFAQGVALASGKAVTGAGALAVEATGVVTVGGAAGTTGVEVGKSGGNLGFFGTTPTTRPSGGGITTAAEIVTALQSLGIFGA